MGLLAARLKSCPDTYRSLKVILQVALEFKLSQVPKSDLGHPELVQLYTVKERAVCDSQPFRRNAPKE